MAINLGPATPSETTRKEKSAMIPEQQDSTVEITLRKLKRPYVRRTTNNAPGIKAPTSPPQIAELAFNIHGWAMEDGLTQRGTFEVINAYRATMVKGGFEAKIRELKNEGVDDIYRQNHAYTPRESDPDLANTDPHVSQYLVIGYTFQEDDPLFKDNKSFARYSENELVGENRPPAESIIPWEAAQSPIFVVTPVKENTGTSVRLFGLIMPRSGLCQPVLLTHERIFYRWEYRASAGARAAQRNKNWNQVIIDKARELTPPEQLLINNPAPVHTPVKRRRLSEPQIKKEEDEKPVFTPMPVKGSEPLDRDTLDLHLNLEVLFESRLERQNSNYVLTENAEVMTRLRIILNEENRTILHGIHKSQSSRVSQQVKAILTKVGMYGRIPDAQCQGLSRFAYPDISLGKGDAELVFHEINYFWPSFLASGILDTNSIMRIKHALNQTHQAVRFECMRDFFCAALAYVKTYPNITAVQLQWKLNEIIQNSASAESAGSRSAGDIGHIGMDTVFLVTLLKEMLIIHHWQDQSTKMMRTTNHLGTFTGMDIEHYLNVETIAEARQELSNHIRLLAGYVQAKACDMDDILFWLEKLRCRIRWAAAEQ